VFALAAVKTNSEIMMTRLTKLQHSILTEEMELHRQYMAEFGVSLRQLPPEAKSSLFNRAYTANMLTSGLTGDLAEMLAGMLPCAWTYYDYATRLKERYADRLETNFYKSWIENYASLDFAESYEWFYEAIDDLTAHKTDAQKERVAEAFISSVEFENLFWDMSYHNK
jgi:thiaminase/transcriptional activator TenA